MQKTASATTAPTSLVMRSSDSDGLTLAKFSATSTGSRKGSSHALSASSSCNATSVRNSLAAGYVAGLTGTLVGYPMDSAKVWIQTNKQHQPTTTLASHLATVTRPGTRSSSSWAAMATNPLPSQVSRNSFQTLRALYRGVCGPLVTVGLVQSLNFAIYDSTRRILYNASHPGPHHPLEYLQDDSMAHVGVASITAGAVLAFVTSPLVMIKTKQQVQQVSFAEAARQTLGDGSLHAISRGFGPHFLSETMGRGIYFCAYELCKRAWADHVSSRSNDPTAAASVSLTGRAMSAGIAGTVCWTLIFPLDVVRSRLFASSEFMTAWNMSRLIYREHGLNGFFRGYGVSIFRAGPVAAMVLPIYDYTLEYLNNNNNTC